MPLPIIRPMTPADVDGAAESILRGDWGDRRVNLRFVTGHGAARPVVADADGAIVGTGVAMLNGSVGWIGTIWVDRDWRRRGIGMELTRATIEAAESAGCRTLVLVATEDGRPMYERLGFEVQTWYRTVEASGTGPIDPDPRIRPFRASDLPAMATLDAAATGEDRRHLLEAFATPGSARCLEREDGTLGGFIVRAPWGGGATIAPGVDDAAAILQARREAAARGDRVRAGLLQENDAGLERLARDGWTEAWRAPRLIRGDALDWRPASIWGQFNHAMG
jgi:predicted N-acetyltransferase YhbS